MEYTAIRLINRFLFNLFFAVFRILSLLRPSKPRDLSKRNFQNILVFSAAGIGDALTDSVAVRALKETFPKARLIVVTHRRRSAIVRHNPFADEVVLYHKSFARFVTLARELRKRRPEVVVMLRGNDPDLWPLAWLVNRNAIVSCPIMTHFKFLISHPVSIPDWDRIHGVEQTLEIVRSLGADTRDRRLVYQVRDVERAQIRDKLIHRGVQGKSMIAFQLGGGWRSIWRDWPVEHFIKLAKTLLAEFKVQLILLGGPDLIARAVAISAALPPEVVNLAGKLTLAEAAALLTEARILVSTDTGIMHLGFAVGIDTLALIHCNNPASRVGPYGYKDKNIAIELKPPNGVEPSKEVDMGLLTPDQVWPKLQLLCQRNRIARRR